METGDHIESSVHTVYTALLKLTPNRLVLDASFCIYKALNFGVSPFSQIYMDISILYAEIHGYPLIWSIGTSFSMESAYKLRNKKKTIWIGNSAEFYMDVRVNHKFTHTSSIF